MQLIYIQRRSLLFMTSAMNLQANTRLLFIGDSITDCGRKRPIGRGTDNFGLGQGYVSLIDAALASGYPDYGIEIINMGVSGDTVNDLRYRWVSDVLDLEPDWLSVLIGINDVWQLIDQPDYAYGSRSPDEFAEILGSLIEQALPNLQGLILMTPYYLETNKSDPMRNLMDRYSQMVEQVANEHKAILVDIQGAFDSILKWKEPFKLAQDRVHINLQGHMLLARSFLQQINFSWDRYPGER